MRVERVDYENYGPFLGQHSLVYSGRGLVLLVGENRDEPRMDSNGSGKSSAVDVLDWVLFGVVPKADHVDSVIHDDASTVLGRVTLWDDAANTSVIVERQKTRGKSTQLQFWVGSTHHAALDIAETQRQLERVLGVDRELFHATVFFGQADVFHFAEATEARRLELLSKILPELAVVDGWGERTKVQSKGLAERIATTDNQLAFTRARLTDEQAIAADVEVKRAQWEVVRTAKLEAKKQRGVELTQTRSQQVAWLAGEDDARAALARAEAAVSLSSDDVSGLDAQIQNAQQHLQMLMGREGTLQGQLQGRQAALLKVQQAQVGRCSECGQPVSAAHLAQEVASIQLELSQLAQPLLEVQAQIQAVHGTLHTLQTQRRLQVERVKAGQLERQNQLGVLRRQVESYVQVRTTVAALDRELETLRADWVAVQNETNPWDLASVQGRIAVMTATEENLVRQLVAFRDEQRYLDFWVDAFANKGLKNYILDHRLGELTDAANEWVRLLTGGTIWVRFETQRMGRSTKKLSNDITIRVFRYNGNGAITERNYRSWSGGEKRRVSWAIDFGLSRLVGARATKRWDTLILDEAFRHVDARGGEAVVDMLRQLRRERSSIFVIEHNSDFQAHFEERVMIVKQNGRARIEETNGHIKEQEAQGNEEGSQALKKKKAGRATSRRRVSVGVGD